MPKHTKVLFPSKQAAKLKSKLKVNKASDVVDELKVGGVADGD
jgi:hypothetical protein